jgi:hypothetical protein
MICVGGVTFGNLSQLRPQQWTQGQTVQDLQLCGRLLVQAPPRGRPCRGRFSGARYKLHRDQSRQWASQASPQKVYSSRGQTKNQVKGWKIYLAPDRTSWTKASANQMRLMLHGCGRNKNHRLLSRS